MVSARQYKDAGNEADEFSVRVGLRGIQSPAFIMETSDGFLSGPDRELPPAFPAPA